MSNQPQATDPGGTIPLADAITITTNWRDFISPLAPTENYIRAFHIPIDDITSLGTFHGVNAVRAYLALGTAGDSSTLKLAMVPVADDGSDVLFAPLTPPATAIEEGGMKQSAVYDFTTPCPQACDINSPLFTGV